MKYIITSILITILFSCSENTSLPTKVVNNKKKVTVVKPPEKIIYIQPLGNVNPEYVNTIKTSVESFFHFKCVIKNKVNLTDDLLSPSKTRYNASNIIRMFNTTDNILMITEKDIACRKGKIPEWGILGLGLCPGTTCVISTFRMKRNVSKSVVLERIKKTSIHEIGHNLGLNHCDNDIHCLMNDAKGTISQTDREKIWFCDKCTKLLRY